MYLQWTAGDTELCLCSWCAAVDLGHQKRPKAVIWDLQSLPWGDTSLGLFVTGKYGKYTGPGCTCRYERELSNTALRASVTGPELTPIPNTRGSCGVMKTSSQDRKEANSLPVTAHPPELQHHHSDLRETDEPGQVKEHRNLECFGKGRHYLEH